MCSNTECRDGYNNHTEACPFHMPVAPAPVILHRTEVTETSVYGEYDSYEEEESRFDFGSPNNPIVLAKPEALPRILANVETISKPEEQPTVDPKRDLHNRILSHLEECYNLDTALVSILLDKNIVSKESLNNVLSVFGVTPK